MRPLLALSFAALASIAGAVVYSPAQAPRTFTEPQKVKWALDKACASDGNTVDLTRGWKVDGLVWESPKREYLSVSIIGSPFWRSVYGKASLKFWNWKDGRIKDLGTNGLSMEFWTDGSSSRNVIDGCRFQDGGILFHAIGGADFSRTSIRDTEVHGAKTGIKVVGPNALDLHLDQVVFTACETGLDLTEGGSDSRWIGGGASLCGTVVKVNAGYQFTMLGVIFEVCERAIAIGGDGAGGHASRGSFRLQVSDVRSTPIALDSQTGGLVEFDCLRASGQVKAKTESPGAQELVLKGAARNLPVSIVGPVKVTGQVTAN